MSAPEGIEELKRRVTDQTDPRPLGDRITAVSQAYAAAIGDHMKARSYSAGEQLLVGWEQFIKSVEPTVTSILKPWLWSQFNGRAGHLSDSRAQYEYHLNGNIVEAIHLYERAEAYHAKALTWLRTVDQKTAATDWFAKTVSSQETEVLRVRGMKLLTQGEFELEAGALPRAKELLESAVSTLTSAEPTGTVSAADDPNSPDFIDYARAMLCRAKSDGALLEGDLAAAAAAEDERARALEQCQAHHALQTDQLYTYFARRLARDAFFARQRHDRFDAAAARQSRYRWIRPAAFSAIAVGCFIYLVYELSRAGSLDFRAFIAGLFFTFAVAGVGAQLAKWGDAADWLRNVLPHKGS
jgi:hypothetical protein